MVTLTIFLTFFIYLLPLMILIDVENLPFDYNQGFQLIIRDAKSSNDGFSIA